MDSNETWWYLERNNESEDEDEDEQDEDISRPRDKWQSWSKGGGF